jgi:pimeloyl-ACP methyl ester carboxylesterase
MLNFKRIIPASLAILTALVVVACGATSPTAMPTPFPTATPIPESTTMPIAKPTLEVQQRPKLPVPALEGDIDVGGRKLSYQCWGEGTPTVIVEAAAGDKPTLSLSWNAVILGVYPITRMCIYDRMNVLTSQDVAENLHALLGEIHVPGPYILVAHSLGGWHARVFAHLYPADVAGMILVDTTLTYPDAAITYATVYPTYSPDESAGITQNRMSEADIYTGEMMPSMDGLDMKASNEQVRQAGSFGDIPLVIIGRFPGPENFPGLDSVAQEQLGVIMLKLEADLATLSSRGSFLVATTHEHFISLYQPQIIIDAITQMVEEIRNE